MIARAYNKKYLIKCIWWLALTTVLMKLSGGLVALLFPLVACSMMYGNKSDKLLYVVLLMISCQIGNAYFFPKSTAMIMSIRGTLLMLSLMMASQLFGHRQSPILTPFKGIFFYVAWMAISSFQGWAPVVSYLKLVLFSLIYLAYYMVANKIILHAQSDTRKVRAVVLCIACLFLLGSVALIPFPGISLMTQDAWGASNVGKIQTLESLFKGMTMHSQSLGPIVAVFATLVLADLVFAVKKFDKLYVCLLLAAPVLIWKTSSRTALATLMGGWMMVALLMFKARGLGARWKGKLISIFWVMLIFGGVAVVALPQTRKSLTVFVLKKQGQEERVQKGDVSLEAVTSTRAGIMEESWRTFKQSPVLGHGFQVSEEMAYEKRSGLKEYLSAPIEKGVWVTAVLEEGGAVGFALFAGFLIVTLYLLVKRHAYISTSCLWTFMLSNMGEFTFFSMSYSGGLIWALVFAAGVLDAQRLRDQRLFEEWLMGNEMAMDRVGMWQ